MDFLFFCILSFFVHEIRSWFSYIFTSLDFLLININAKWNTANLIKGSQDGVSLRYLDCGCYIPIFPALTVFKNLLHGMICEGLFIFHSTDSFQQTKRYKTVATLSLIPRIILWRKLFLVPSAKTRSTPTRGSNHPHSPRIF